MKWKVPLADLDYGVEEENAVLNVLRSKWLTMGAVSQQFEREFADRVGAKHAVAVSNATVALHLACLSIGIKPGDEVIVPSLTFVATANAARYAGAEVKFADILGPQNLNISPASIESKITSKTRAIIVVHYAGYPCQMPKILEIAERHNLAVIEDAAHAPGASLAEKSLGTWGDAGCFSFFSNKNLSTGEGGMLVTDNDDVAEKARLLRSHGMTSLTWDRHRGHAYSYDVTALGFNYRIDEIRSALGLVQLSKLDKGNARRKEITERYWDAFISIGLELPFLDSVGESAYHIFPVMLPKSMDRKALIDHLRAVGIQTSIHYPPIHLFTHYQEIGSKVDLPATEEAASREVTLPLFPSMSDQQVESVIDTIKEYFVTEMP